MAHFLFVDESGYDAGESPYGVLAGIGVEDRDLWSLVKDIRTAERNHFGGILYSAGERELKAKKLLKRKVFRQAAALDSFVQLADLLTYTISWGIRFRGMDAPVRTELDDLAQRVLQLRHRSIREVNQNANFVVWSLAYIRDLRSREERDTDAVEELLREDQEEEE